MYTKNIFNYNRRSTLNICVGELQVGGDMPIRVQTMANTNTNDIESSVMQAVRVALTGAELFRFTTQGIREAESLGLIHAELRKRGVTIPLVADVHFNANVADVAAAFVEKVRVNPGNYVAGIKTDSSDYTPEEFADEYNKIKSRFTVLLDICKQHHTAIRLGINHGSLSERIMNRYGDTAQGMVASCMEFLDICHQQNFDNVIISMKTSNTVMMVQAVRLLVHEMNLAGYAYPLHLGVTEAGDGEDGRIKSAVGIGALLADGIGDTIRVSLSEDPEFEIPVARLLTDYISARTGHPYIEAFASPLLSGINSVARKSKPVMNIGGGQTPIVVAPAMSNFSLTPDYVCTLSGIKRMYDSQLFEIIDCAALTDWTASRGEAAFVKLSYKQLTPEVIATLRRRDDIVILMESDHINPVGEYRAFIHTLQNESVVTPVIVNATFRDGDKDSFQIKAAADLGLLFIEGLVDGILLDDPEIDPDIVNSTAFGILQAARVRVTRTEYISCPGCGRTMFNLQQVIARVKERTSHLKGVKIAIMGCIVNGPGEMADADYGYVGAGRSKVSLYKKKECLEKNISEEDAVEKLIQLIKENGDWHE